MKRYLKSSIGTSELDMYCHTVGELVDVLSELDRKTLLTSHISSNKCSLAVAHIYYDAADYNKFCIDMQKR